MSRAARHNSYFPGDECGEKTMSDRPSRRDLLCAVGATATASLAGCSLPAVSGPECESDVAGDTYEPAADEWPMVGFDAGNAAHAPDRTPIDPDGATVAWQQPVAGLPGAVLVGGGRVYAPSDPGVDAFAMESGERRLRITPDDEDASVGSYALGGGRLYLTVARESIEESAFALAAYDHDGGQAWRTPIGDRVLSRLALTAGGVVLAEREEKLRSVAAEDGTERWHAGHQGTPAVDRRRVYVAGSGARVVALDRDTGGRCWSFAPAIPRMHDLTVGGGAVYAAGRLEPEGGNDGILCVDPADGTERWRVQGRGRVDAPAVTDAGVYVVDERSLRMLDHDGRERWSVPLSAATSVSRAVVVGEVVYVNVEGRVRAFDVDSGRPAGSVDLDGTVGRLAVVDGSMYASVDDHTADEVRIVAIR